MNVVELIRFRGKPADLHKMIEILSLSGDLTKIRAEKGCCYFDFFYSANDDNEILLLEKWGSEEDLSAHHQTAMMANLKDLINDYSLELNAEKYEV